jgi:uncharacterized protein (TIRG00374 family)
MDDTLREDGGGTDAEPDRRAAKAEPRELAGVRIFSSAPHAPRARRPTDAVLLVLAIIGMAALSVPAPGPTQLDTAVSELVATLPGLAGWFWEISYALLLIWSIALLVLTLVARARKRLFVDLLIAVAVALGLAIVGGMAAGTDASTSLDAILNSSSPPIYLATRLAVATAVVVTASPHLARPMRSVGRWLLVLGAISGIALGAVLPIGVVAGVLIGLIAATLTHLAVGSPGGRLTLPQISEALAALGVDADEIHEAERQPRGVELALGVTSDGLPIFVKIFGRDAWDGQLAAAAWQAITHRGVRPLGSGRLQQVEHEALVTLLAERGGVPVMPVVAVGRVDQGDAVLVLEAHGRALADLQPGEIDDDLLRRCWEGLRSLHQHDVAHGRLDAHAFRVDAELTPRLTSFGSARVAPPLGDLLIDRAQALVTTALATDADRAVAAAIDVLGDDGAVEMLPYLQRAAVDEVAKRSLHGSDWTVKDLRQMIADRTSSEVPPLEPLRRFTWRWLAKIAIAGLLAYALVSAFAGISLDQIVDEFKNADKAWLGAALLVTPFVQIPQAFSTLGATLHPVRFWPVLMLQYGVQFISLLVPSSAARVALEIRFFQRVGVPGAGAISIGALDSFSTFLLQVLLIVVILVSGVVSVDLPSSDPSTSSGSGDSVHWQALLVAAGLVVVALLIALAVPKTRESLRRFAHVLRQKAADAKEALRVLRHPRKVLALFLGNLVAQVMLAAILGLCLEAFGQSASLAALILVNTFVSLFAGFMPVPGGVGVAEAGYTAGLIAIGIPDSAATSTAMAYRLVSFYLPPLWGTFAMRWMKRNSYV